MGNIANPISRLWLLPWIAGLAIATQVPALAQSSRTTAETEAILKTGTISMAGFDGSIDSISGAVNELNFYVLTSGSAITPVAAFCYVGNADSPKKLTIPANPGSIESFLLDVAKQADCRIKVEGNTVIVFPDAEFHFFKSSEGKEYEGITGLRPGGALCTETQSTSGVARRNEKTFIPWAKLPQEIKTRYDGPVDSSLAALIKSGIDGDYQLNTKGAVFVSVDLNLSGGKFTYNSASDVVSGKSTPAPKGSYAISGHWLLLDTDTGAGREFVLADVNGTLAVMNPSQYLLWKDWGIAGYGVLFRKAIGSGKQSGP
jgi:hypothetical protein